MLIQVRQDRFVAFTYNPDYLRDDAELRDMITDAALVCEKIGLSTEKTDILVDGGNVIRSRSRVIMTDKIYGTGRLLPH